MQSEPTNCVNSAPALTKTTVGAVEVAVDSLSPQVMNLKTCTRCKVEKPRSEFNRARGTKDGLQHRCRVCGRLECRKWYEKNKDNERRKSRVRAKVSAPVRRAAYKKWAIANPERARYLSRSKLFKKQYGMTVEQHEALFLSQGSKCAACGTDNPGSKKGWSTDHCHATGKVRGIVCHHCNIGIGHAKDNIETIRSWISYLERTSGAENHAQETETARSKIGKATT